MQIIMCTNGEDKSDKLEIFKFVKHHSDALVNKQKLQISQYG